MTPLTLGALLADAIKDEQGNFSMMVTAEYGNKRLAQACLRILAEHGYRIVGAAEEGEVERDISGETVLGLRVAAYRETHPEHGDKYGHRYSEHWSTPNTRDPRVKVERLFTEDQLRTAIAALSASRASEQPADDEAAIEAIARAMAEHDWVGEPVADVWAELEPCDQEYYLAHARIARGGMAVRGER